MKNQLMILSVLAALATANVNAQNTNRLKADVPFSFHVGSSTMPAGEYDVQTNALASGVLMLRSADCKAIVNILSIPAQTLDSRDKGKLVFNRYHGEYFLSEVWNAGTNTGALLKKTRRELEIAKSETTRDQSVIYAKAR